MKELLQFITVRELFREERNVRIEIIVIASASYGIGIDGLEMGYLSPL